MAIIGPLTAMDRVTHDGVTTQSWRDGYHKSITKYMYDLLISIFWKKK
jgi:hypothetical protein